MLLKARHNLTNCCINDLCSLPIQIGIKNSPKSIQQIKRILSPSKNPVDSIGYSVCNECASLYQGKSQCSNSKCKLFHSVVKHPTEFLHFPIESQLTSILSRTKLKFIDNQSLWIFTAAINEITRKQRFKLHNMLVLGISSGLCKPSKAQMQSMLQPIVDNFIKIETGIRFDTPDQRSVWGKVFLILSCNDKPAQALLQNLGEAHGRFGCGSCTIEG